MEALGQVIRNFSQRLPGSDKVEVLAATYQLGLRLQAAGLQVMSDWMWLIESKVKEGELPTILRDDLTPRENMRRVEDYATALAKGFAFTVTKRLSRSVGVVDQEQAYDAAIRCLTPTNATRIIDIAVRLDHYRSFPQNEIEDFSAEVTGSPFVTGLLHWLILTHLMMYRVDEETRRAMTKVLRADPAKVRALQNRAPLSTRQS